MLGVEATSGYIEKIMLQPNERMFLHLLDYLFDSISVAFQYVLHVAFNSSAVAGHYFQ